MGAPVNFPSDLTRLVLLALTINTVPGNSVATGEDVPQYEYVHPTK